MSEQATLVTTELLRYLANLVTTDDPFLAELKSEARRLGIPSIWVSPEQAMLIQILLKLNKARTVLEIGALVGYSAITMARALPADGLVETIEIHDPYADLAQRWVDKSNVATKVRIRRGNAADLLSNYDDASFDASFIDADKANYPLYLKECLRIVRPGGLVLVDNAFAYGQLLDDEPMRKDDVWAIRAFNNLMARQPGLTSVIVPIGDGMWVSLKDG